MQEPLSASQICKEVSKDLKKRGITQQMAADLLGKSKASVSNQISGKKPFGKKMAAAFAKTFGYDINFLLYGIGGLYHKSLYDGNSAINLGIGVYSDPVIDYNVLTSFVELAEFLLDLADNRSANESWNAIMSGDEKLFKEKLAPLWASAHKEGRLHKTMYLHILNRVDTVIVPFMKNQGFEKMDQSISFNSNEVAQD